MPVGVLVGDVVHVRVGVELGVGVVGGVVGVAGAVCVDVGEGVVRGV